MADGIYYHDYLKLDQLLGAQELESAGHGQVQHDEMLFIIVHQAYELWFKQIIWELDDVIAAFGDKRLDETHMGRIIDRLVRIVAIQNLILSQIDVLETMTSLDFLDFRDHLYPASGFQSVQFRIIENKLGIRREDRVSFAGAPYTARFSPEHRDRVEAAEAATSLHDVVEAWLERTPFLDQFDFWSAFHGVVVERLEEDRNIIARNPNLTDEERAEQLKRFETTLEQSQAIFDPEAYATMVKTGERRFSYEAFQAALFISLYRDQPALHLPHRLLELLMDVDEGLTLWRYRHALMTQRMIGRRVGTGGSAGAAYLTAGARKSRAFPDLLALPTFLIPRHFRPPLPEDLIEHMRFRYETEGID